MANKPTAKAAWDALKTRHIGVDRVRKARAQTLRQEFNGLTFKEGETVDDFAYRITKITDQLAILGDAYEEEKIIRSLPRGVGGRLKAIEERLDHGRGKGGGGSGGGGVGKEIDGKLYFTKEQVMARLTFRLNLNSDGSAGRGKRRGGTGRGKERGKETRSGY
ncbi:unnamed protein product [Miscanthus lutarioriparius]|uniref:Uncharacterized protein n=1 Tax=Miscanthus lutarioriparius TaxID=422564 RepID=A0A811NK02_9POAL|nr:unnamed protein product [Miscanthus lutarioriparius]